MAECRTCRHWRRLQDWEADAADMNKCEAARPRWKITDPIERNSTVSWKETQEKKSAALNAAKAYVQDGSDYYAELVTAADFFCALYEKTDADN